VDRAVAAAFLPMLKPGFKPFKVGIFADDEAWDILHAARYPWLDHARFLDFGREYLSQNCSVKVVEDLDEALQHIADFGSRHSEAIVTNHPASAERFLAEVDAAAVYHNASTRFTDGGEFGLGAEMGISTQKLHARGPFALEKLVCEKWVVRGSGQVR
jgi:glutamate-5-semialdehyde dehydrogenase